MKHQMGIISGAALVGILSAASAFACGTPDPTVVGSVDLDKYAGLWYEVAHSPNLFQKKCARSTAQYEVKSPTSISVFNTCYEFNGKTKTISGLAHIVDESVPAKLSVKFTPWYIPKGKYWITELDPNYQWAVVSSPKKHFTFILSREKNIDPTLKEQIVSNLNEKGFDTGRFVYDQNE